MTDLTDLTSHPDWQRLAGLFNSLEKQAVEQLKAKEDADANRFLIALARVKSEISCRSRNPNVWKVQS